MSAATNSTSLHSAADVAWTNIVRDIRDGALATARLVVTFAGCTTLLVAAILFANDDVRAALKTLLPQPVTQVTMPRSPRRRSRRQLQLRRQRRPAIHGRNTSSSIWPGATALPRKPRGCSSLPLTKSAGNTSLIRC